MLLIYGLCVAFPLYADTQDTIEERVNEDRAIGTAMAKGVSVGKWVAVPIPVSNPTIGTGLQGALLYLHPRKAGEESAPNATSGIGGMYTDTGSWAIGAFHEDSWNNDQYRFMGLFGYGRLSLNYYGGGNVPTLPNPLGYDLNVLVAMPQIQMRLPGTEAWYIGASYLYLDSESNFHLSDIISILPDAQLRIVSAGLGLLVTYDSRNDNYYPARGQYLQVRMTNFSERWGSDDDYHKTKMQFSDYHVIAKRTTLALSSRLESSSTDTPFFNLPYLDLRGFSRGRYQDFNTLSLHAEVRHQFQSRWGMIAFSETGWYSDSLKRLSNNPRVTSYGAGVRWRTTEDRPLNLGVDVAFTDNDTVYYIRVGEKF